MALHLKRVTDPYFCCHCDVTRRMIAYMDYYYEDDEDGFIVDYNYYYDRKLAVKRQEAMNNYEFQKGMDSLSYQAMMLEQERRLFEQGLFDREIVGKIPEKGGGYLA